MKLYPPHKSFGDLSIYCASMIHCIFKNDTTQLTAKLKRSLDKRVWGHNSYGITKQFFAFYLAQLFMVQV